MSEQEAPQPEEPIAPDTTESNPPTDPEGDPGEGGDGDGDGNGDEAE